MALTVRALAAQRDLDVQIIAGAGAGAGAGTGTGTGTGTGAWAGDRAAGDRPITWVHVSELDDPTPFLSGGELLLTTGLFIRDGVDLHAYIDKLCKVGVLGLGFGVGLSFEQVPAGLVAAADRLDLPLLEVPRRTPFIALSRAVSKALAADEYAAVTRTFTAQQELTRAALSPESPSRLIRLLARKIDGWAALLDERGASVAVSGERAGAMVPAVAVEVARLREHHGSVAAGFQVDGDSVSLQPVGAGARRAFLAVGRPGPLPAADRHLVNAAVMLLTLGLEQDTAAPDAMAAIRAALLELAFGGHLPLARSVAARVRIAFPDEPLVVLVVRPFSGPVSAPGPTSARRRSEEQLPAPGSSTRTEWDRWEASQRHQPGNRMVGAEIDGESVLVAAADAAAELAAELARGRRVGYSGPCTGAGLGAAREQARQAASAAADRGVPVLGFDAIGTSGITGLLNPAQAGAFVQSLLAPLVEHDRTGRGDLVASLREWLAHHGQWDPAAAALGVHRHTLRRRMGLAGQLLGRDLDSPTVRSELWLALELAGPGTTDARDRPDRTKSAAGGRSAQWRSPC